jgi:hypothetical protein
MCCRLLSATDLQLRRRFKRWSLEKNGTASTTIAVSCVRLQAAALLFMHWSRLRLQAPFLLFTHWADAASCSEQVHTRNCSAQKNKKLQGVQASAACLYGRHPPKLEMSR